MRKRVKKKSFEGSKSSRREMIIESEVRCGGRFVRGRRSGTEKEAANEDKGKRTHLNYRFILVNKHIKTERSMFTDDFSICTGGKLGKGKQVDLGRLGEPLIYRFFSTIQRTLAMVNGAVLRRTHFDRISLSPRTRLERIWVSSCVTSGETTASIMCYRWTDFITASMRRCQSKIANRLLAISDKPQSESASAQGPH